VLAGVLIAAAGAGCSTDTSSSSSTRHAAAVDHATSNFDSGGAGMQQPADPPGTGAKRAVRAYYGALDGQAYRAAWRRLTPGEQAHLGRYDAWQHGFENTVSTTLASVELTDASSSDAMVSVELRTVDLDACGNDVRQRFSGTWHLARVDGRWLADSIDMQKVAGRTPVTDVDQCDSGTGSGPPDTSGPPSSSVPDPGNQDPSTFCDTHDCIPNFDNGRGSIVQCADGEWSQSGGIQGACSGHGGEAPKVVVPGSSPAVPAP
jgi:hypothetical protein